MSIDGDDNGYWSVCPVCGSVEVEAWVCEWCDAPGCDECLIYIDDPDSPSDGCRGCDKCIGPEARP